MAVLAQTGFLTQWVVLFHQNGPDLPEQLHGSLATLAASLLAQVSTHLAQLLLLLLPPPPPLLLLLLPE